MIQSAGLFMGVNSYTWDLNNFDVFVNDAIQLGFNQVLIKVYEITQGDWYQSLGGSKVVFDHIRAKGIDVLPYGYFYGFNPGVEVQAAMNYLHTFGKFCLDMESEFDNNSAAMQPFQQGLQGHVGDLYISTWANPVDHNWIQNVQMMDPLTKAWMPQVYNPYLVSVYQQQYSSLTDPGKIQPTYSVNDTPISNWTASIFTAWDYGSIVSNGPAESTIKNLLSTQVITTSKRSQFNDVWYQPAGGVPTGYRSGIYRAVLDAFLHSTVSACFPTSPEIRTTDWSGHPIMFQTLSNGLHAEYRLDTGITYIYTAENAGVYHI